MNCSRVQELLPDYSVEILSEREQRAIRAHLESCGACLEEFQAMERAVALVEEFGVREPPAGLFNAVRNRIESGSVARERPAWWAWFYTKPARVGAMGLAMASVLVGLLMPVNQQSLPTIAINPGGRALTGVASGELAGAIRLHAMANSNAPLTDRVAWEAMAQIVTQQTGDDSERSEGGPRVQ